MRTEILFDYIPIIIIIPYNGDLVFTVCRQFSIV